MGSSSVLSESSVSKPSHASERRKSPRFDMHFAVFMRALGDPWALTQTSDVSAAGASFITDRPFLLNTPVEYVLTFPQELTKAERPLRVRFYASVLRCERIPDGDGSFGVAVRNSAHRYLTLAESADFDKLEPKSGPPTPREDSGSSLNTAT
jgi:hypothetical protein